MYNVAGSLIGLAHFGRPRTVMCMSTLPPSACRPEHTEFTSTRSASVKANDSLLDGRRPLQPNGNGARAQNPKGTTRRRQPQHRDSGDRCVGAISVYHQSVSLTPGPTTLFDF